MNLQSGPIMDPSAQSESLGNLIFQQAVNLLSDRIFPIWSFHGIVLQTCQSSTELTLKLIKI